MFEADRSCLNLIGNVVPGIRYPCLAAVRQMVSEGFLLSPSVGFSFAIMVAFFTSCMDFKSFVAFAAVDDLASLAAVAFDLKVFAPAVGATGQFLLPGHDVSLLNLSSLKG